MEVFLSPIRPEVSTVARHALEIINQVEEKFRRSIPLISRAVGSMNLNLMRHDHLQYLARLDRLRHEITMRAAERLVRTTVAGFAISRDQYYKRPPYKGRSIKWERRRNKSRVNKKLFE